MRRVLKCVLMTDWLIVQVWSCAVDRVLKSIHLLIVRILACVVCSSPLEVIQGVTTSISIVNLECEMPTGCTILAHCLTVKPHPDWSLVAEPSLSTMRLRFAVFLKEKFSTDCSWQFVAGGSHRGTYPYFLTGGSCRVDGISLGTFPIPWFAWVLLAVLVSLLDPSKTIHPCLLLFVRWSRLWGFSTALKCAFQFIPGLMSLPCFKVTDSVSDRSCKLCF